MFGDVYDQAMFTPNWEFPKYVLKGYIVDIYNLLITQI